MTLKVELVSDFNSPTGYSAHARALVSSLIACDDIDLRLKANKADRADVILDDETKDIYRELMNKEGRPDVRIHFEIPIHYTIEEGVYTIGFTQWETTGIPHHPIESQTSWDWVTLMNCCHEIWTSAADAQIAFDRSGVKRPIHLVPGPIDTDYFNPERRELQIRGLTVTEAGQAIPRESRPKIVGFMGAWNKRKNIEDWLVWLKTQFKPTHVAGLLKTSVGTIGQGNQKAAVAARVKQIQDLCKQTQGSQIHYITEKLTDEEIARFFMTPDVYVSFARGEGLDLPTLQAMASGCLVMHTNWGATRDYVITARDKKGDVDLANSTGFALPFQFEPVYGMEYTPYWSDQWWARVSLHEATVLAGQIFTRLDNNPESFDQLKENARKIVVERSSIPAITKVLNQRFREIRERLKSDADGVRSHSDPATTA